MENAPKSRYATLQQQDNDFSYDNRLPLEPSSQPGIEHQVAEHRGMDGARRSIFLALAVILVPMLGLSALLIGLILANEVDKQSNGSNPLAFTQKSDTDDNAYYVDFNATTLATISSWSSTVAPLLAVAAMSLASFPISKALRERSQSQSTDLPTPFQLSMLLDSLSGSVAALFTLGKYRFWPHKQSLASFVQSAFVVLIIASIIGYAITGVDTWLHLVMNTVSVDVGTARAPQRTFGRGFGDIGCVNSTDDFEACSVSLAATGTFLYSDGPEAYATVGNLSNLNAVRRTTINDQTFAYLGPANIPDNLDFQASTVALGTHCESITKQCKLQAEAGADTGFHCNDHFYGNIEVPSIDGSATNSYSDLPLDSTSGIVYFQDPALTRFANASFYEHIRNPYHLGVWGRPNLANSAQQLASGAFVTPVHGGQAWLLNCTSTAYDMSYSWVNGTVQSANVTKANGTVSTNLQAPLFYSLGTPWLATAAYGAGAEPDGESLSEAWSTSYSKLVMGLSAAYLSNRTNVLEQTRQTRLVSRIPKVPLYFLIALNVVYAILGVALAIAALASRPHTNNDVRERLSVAGLVAYCFEGTRAQRPVEKRRQMFTEYDNAGTSRIGVERSAYDGWEYTLRQRIPKTVE